MTGALLATSPGVARAEEAGVPGKTAPGKTVPGKAIRGKKAAAAPFFVGFGAGAGYAMMTYPTVMPASFVAPILNIHTGFTVGEHITLGLGITTMEAPISRNSVTEMFQVGGSPRACGACQLAGPRGNVLSTTLVLGAIESRVEYAPFRRDGLFIATGAGLAFRVGLEERAGLSFTGSLGYRVRPAELLTLSLEAGMQTRLYEDAKVTMPFALLSVRPYF